MYSEQQPFMKNVVEPVEKIEEATVDSRFEPITQNAEHPITTNPEQQVMYSEQQPFEKS